MAPDGIRRQPSEPVRLVAEVANPRHQHRGAGLLGRIDHLGVAHGAARLSEGSDPSLEADLDSVRERVERVGAASRALESVDPLEGDRLRDGLASGIDPARLTRAQACLLYTSPS